MDAAVPEADGLAGVAVQAAVAGVRAAGAAVRAVRAADVPAQAAADREAAAVPREPVRRSPDSQGAVLAASASAMRAGFEGRGSCMAARNFLRPSRSRPFVRFSSPIVEEAQRL